tara:strand:- start:455 stop:571 length:117 start_codon:yes stop_codon:yes gene_type:complete
MNVSFVKKVLPMRAHWLPISVNQKEDGTTGMIQTCNWL